MLSPGQRQTGMPAVDLPDRLSNSINSKCQHLTPFYASVNTFSILPKSPLMARQLHQVSQHNIYSDRDENDEQFMQILPWIVKKLQALIKMGALLQPAWLASSWSSHPHLQVTDNNDDGDEWRWKQTYPGLPSLSTWGAVCASKHSQAHLQNPSCLIEGGDAEAFNMSTQIRLDATAVWSRSER